MISSLFIGSPWSWVNGDLGNNWLARLPPCCSGRGFSKDRSPVPRHDATRHVRLNRSLLIPRVVESVETHRAIDLQYIATAKAPCQALSALFRNFFCRQNA